MKKYLFLPLLILTLNSYAQIHYSSRIPGQELSVMQRLERKLKSTEYTLGNILSDTMSRMSYTDSVTYAGIFKTFFDTADIKFFAGNMNYSLEKSEDQNILKGMTVSGLIGIHNMIRCAPDSIFFVMPAGEYYSLDSNDKENEFSNQRLLFAGYKAEGFYYPYISILFSESQQKIVYINILINFEGFPKDKRDNFTKNILPLIAPCTRMFSNDYGPPNTP